LILDVGRASYRGRAHEHNGDYYSVAQHWVTDAQLAEKGWLFLLADGIGGEQPGESSRHAVNRLYQLYYTHPSNNIRQSLQHALNRVNNEIYEEAKRHQAKKSVMLLAAVVKGGALYIANSGQVRAYLCHKGRLHQVTPDHPWEEVLPPPRSEEELAKAEAEGNLPPARSLGSSRRLAVDWARRRFAVGDVLLLCTDGLYQTLSAGEIQQAVAENPKAQAAADRLVGLAGQQESEDDATAVVGSATAKKPGKGVMALLASWLFWVGIGVAILIAVVGLATWRRSLSISGPTLSPTATNTARMSTLPVAVRPTSTPRPTATASPTMEPTATEKPKVIQPQPTATAPLPSATFTPLPVLYNAPKVIAPYDGEAVYEGENNVLVWQWYRQLGADELFEIRMWREGSEPPARGTTQTPWTEFRFGVPFGRTGKYYWNVMVVRKTVDSSVVVSVSSETHFFWWMGPRPPATPPTPTPLPPTNTPPPTVTPVPPTNTPLPPTSTPVPPTNTPLPPTPTPLP